MTKKTKTKKARNWLVNILIILLFLVGLALIFNSVIKDVFISKNTNHYQISNVSKSQIKKNEKAKVSYNFDDVNALSFQSVLGAQLDGNPLPVVGGIAVPDVSINLPIFKGVNNISLMYGAGTMKPDQVMGKGNYALASHTSSGFNVNQGNLFTPLQHVKDGMMIYLTDKSNIYEYKISSVRVLNRSHIEVISDVPGRKMVTLVTCETRGSNNRIIVQGDLTKIIPFDKATGVIEKAFEIQYNIFYKPSIRSLE